MTRRAPDTDPDEDALEVGERKHGAAGIRAVTEALVIANEQMGVRRTALTLTRLNQKHGFDCPGCAWPDPDHRSPAEFCENGAKAVAEEATLRRVTRAFFAEHAIADLAEKTDYWLGQQGRLTEPMHRPPGATHYQPISWDDAFTVIADRLRALPSPDAASFYTSGRTSNEAAFLYQLLVRRFGTNNLPDCSNMCHESSGAALAHSIGIGKGSVLLEDLYAADLILVVGQNPGTNHPRMLSALEKAKANGAHIVAINPLDEAGLRRFRNPQSPVGLVKGTELADELLQVRLAGDQALFAALGQLTVDAGAVDEGFVTMYCSEYPEYVEHLATLDWDQVIATTGLARDQIESLAQRYRSSDRVIVCWAMGLTQHRDAVATIAEITNLMLLRGNIGKPGAGLCPVRGHSNVQGDRTMGIWEKAPQEFLDALGIEFGFTPRREHGLDAVDTIRAMRDGRVRAFIGLGGNFVAATPDTAVTSAAMSGLDLTVQVSTKLNRSHAVCGTEALILPCLGRTERDQQAAGPQVVSVEDSMGVVHVSRGRLDPATDDLLSEVAIVTRLAEALLRDDTSDAAPIDWAGLRADYDRIRDHISRVVPDFEDFNARVHAPGGFALPHPPRDRREFPTATGKARFTVSPLTPLEVPPGHLLLQTLRSHDQFNTTVYGLDDRYRGIKAGRRVVFVNPDDLADLGIADGRHVDLVSVWSDGERRAEDFRAVAYETARGCAAAYFPETNVLVPLDAVATVSNTPASKSLVIRLELSSSSAPAAAAPPGRRGAAGAGAGIIHE
ncbi:MAG TPA: FdhF/YdeP family oxidoreductase [Marmoricola sp.]|jgi:molybdopterin-dependent oxidoreductase alpha subunit|nr:FdhF/YdeP family oxidoreductase [Marmoricola sp.]